MHDRCPGMLFVLYRNMRWVSCFSAQEIAREITQLAWVIVPQFANVISPELAPAVRTAHHAKSTRSYVSKTSPMRLQMVSDCAVEKQACLLLGLQTGPVLREIASNLEDNNPACRETAGKT